MAIMEGQQLGAYQLLQQMGSGGMATVYKAWHARLDRHVAIKVMHESFLQDSGFLARFEREAQIVARLEHPNIIPVYDFAEAEGRPYLVMKFIEGETLKAKLNRGAPTLDDVRRLLPPIADALDYAHRQGILHRDIKPSNILLDAQGMPYLSDFGLARIAQLGESTLSQDVVLGTPQYISPEQAMGRRDLTPATDLYSFGVVIYEMLVGRVPFSSDTPFSTIHDHIYRALPVPSSINSQLTPAIDDVLVRALAKRPEDRFESARAMVTALMEAIDSANLTALDPARRQTAEESLARARDAQDAADDARTTPLPVRFAPPTPPPGVPPPQPPQPPSVPGGIPASGRHQFEVGKRKVEVSWDLGRFDLHSLGQKIEEVAADIEEAVDDVPTAERLLGRDEAAIRRRVEHDVKQRGEMMGHIGAFIGVNILMWVIFGLSGATFPFPVLVMFGWGAGLLAHIIEVHYQTGERARRRLMAVERALIDEYGYDWERTATKKQIKLTRRKAEKPFTARTEWYQHLAVYVMINIMLWTIFGLTNAGELNALVNQFDPEAGEIAQGVLGFPWPIIVMLGWGIGLFAHGAEVFGAASRERAIQRQLERERAFVSAAKAKRGEQDVTVIEGRSAAVSLDDLLDDGKQKRGARIREDGEFTDSMVEELRDRRDRRA